LQHVVCIVAALLCRTVVAQPVEVKLFFNIPAHGAELALKAFSEQSGKGVIMNTNTVDGIHTNHMEGHFAPPEALQRMLAGTGLVATLDERSDAFVVHRAESARPPPLSSSSDPTSPDSKNPPKPMKTNKPTTQNKLIALLTGWLALTSVPTINGQTTDPAAAAQNAGAIAGRVLNATNGNYVERARVAVEGTGLETFTDEAGFYRLTRVPAGTVKVKVFFTGLVTQTSEVAVSEGRTIVHDITLEGFQKSGTAGGAVVKLGGVCRHCVPGDGRRGARDQRSALRAEPRRGGGGG